MSISLIIPAAGVGKRFSKDVKKQFIEIDNRPLIYYSIKRLLAAYNFNELIIGLNKDNIPFMQTVIYELHLSIPVKYIEGGKERVNTVLNCINASTCDMVAVHDSVRPFASDKTIINTIEKAKITGGAICALPVRDTVKKSLDNNIINTTVSRDNLYLAHTPQVFKKDTLLYALNKTIADNYLVTDEASACEYCNIAVNIVLSNYENIKITYQEDMKLINIFKNKFFR